MITQHTVQRHNVATLVDCINSAYRAGQVVTVNGVEASGRYSNPPARAYQNGTLSLSTKARTTRGWNDVYFKVGTEIRINSKEA